LSRAGQGERPGALLVETAPALLRTFNQAGVLAACDVHVATRLAELAGEREESVMLAAALAVRAPRLGHVYVDLRQIAATATAEELPTGDPASLPWPDPEPWIEAVAASQLVGVVTAHPPQLPGVVRPLRLVASRLYLDRYWNEERQLAADLIALAQASVDGADLDLLADGLTRLYGDRRTDRQALAAACAVLRRLTVVAGGPGTGKTTTVARIAALLLEQAVGLGARAPAIALAAPTGRAAARLAEAVGAEADRLAVDERVRVHLRALDASTLHRLLGARPDSHSRFAHHRDRPLPHDVVIVDETSMVSLSLMARLLEAIGPRTRLVLVGDPGQLVSIEAGAVLADIVGPAARTPVMSGRTRALLARVTGGRTAAAWPAGGSPAGGAADAPGGGAVDAPGGGAVDAPGGGAVDAPGGGVAGGALADRGIGDGIVVLDRGHRFGGEIARLAAAVRAGDSDEALELLSGSSNEITWVAFEELDRDGGSDRLDLHRGGQSDGLDLHREIDLEAVRRPLLETARAMFAAAQAGDARAALRALGSFRILCAHRHGPRGVDALTARIESWLAVELGRPAPPVRGGQRRARTAGATGEGVRGSWTAPTLGGEWYVGRPLLVTENDYELGLFNGDTGVIVRVASGRVAAAFARAGQIVTCSPTRLSAVETVYAMTIHKSQGSQFDTVAVLLPDLRSRLLRRELLYTAITRARRRLIVAGSAQALRAAVHRPLARASGLRDLLWGER